MVQIGIAELVEKELHKNIFALYFLEYNQILLQPMYIVD